MISPMAPRSEQSPARLMQEQEAALVAAYNRYGQDRIQLSPGITYDMIREMKRVPSSLGDLGYVAFRATDSWVLTSRGTDYVERFELVDPAVIALRKKVYDGYALVLNGKVPGATFVEYMQAQGVDEETIRGVQSYLQILPYCDQR